MHRLHFSYPFIFPWTLSPLIFHALVHSPAHHCILTEDAVSPLLPAQVQLVLQGSVCSHLSPALPLDPHFPAFHHNTPASGPASPDPSDPATWLPADSWLLSWNVLTSVPMSVLVILAPPLLCCVSWGTGFTFLSYVPIYKSRQPPPCKGLMQLPARCCPMWALHNGSHWKWAKEITYVSLIDPCLPHHPSPTPHHAHQLRFGSEYCGCLPCFLLCVVYEISLKNLLMRILGISHDPRSLWSVSTRIFSTEWLCHPRIYP